MNMNSLSKNIGAAARQQLNYRTATPQQKTEFFNKLHYNDTPLWLNSSLAEYYEQPLDAFKELYCGFLCFRDVALFPKTFQLARNSGDTQLFHTLDLIKNNYEWLCKSFYGETQEEVPYIGSVEDSFDKYLELWNNLSAPQRKMIQSLYKIYIKGEKTK